MLAGCAAWRVGRVWPVGLRWKFLRLSSRLRTTPACVIFPDRTAITGMAGVHRRRTGRTAAAHRYPRRTQERRDRLPDHLCRLPRGTTGSPRCVGPGPLDHRERGPLGARRTFDEDRFQVPHRHRTQGHGCATPSSACSAAPPGPVSPSPFHTMSEPQTAQSPAYWNTDKRPFRSPGRLHTAFPC